MASIHEVGIGADTKQFERGIRDGVIDPVEDADKALDNLGRNNGAEKLEDGLKGAQRASEDLGDTGAASLRKIGDKGSEVSGELRQNLGETFSSFRGDLTDLPQIAQDTLGGLAGSGALGGIPGLAATAAGAAGLGLVIGAMDNISAQSEQMKQTVSKNFRDMADNGVEAWESVQAQNQRLTDAYADHEGEIRKIAALVGLPFETVAGAWAGNVDALAKVNGAYGEMTSQLRETFGVTQEGTAATIDGWSRILGPLNDTIKGYDLAKEKAQQLGDQQSQMLLQAVHDAGTATEAVDEFGNKLYTLPDNTEVLIDAKTGQASANVDKFAGDLDGKIPKVKTVDVRANVRANTSDYDAAIARLKRNPPDVYVTVRRGRQLLQ